VEWERTSAGAMYEENSAETVKNSKAENSTVTEKTAKGVSVQESDYSKGFAIFD
jgi:hypothetical protein